MFPSIHEPELVSGKSYAHYSPVPSNLTCNHEVNAVDLGLSTLPTSDKDIAIEGTPCILGVDEAGRGPVIGPMLYSAFYLPLYLHPTLLTTSPNVFDDSKILTPPVRTQLMQNLCSPGSGLYENCGWAIKSLSAPSISEGMLRKNGRYSLNDQAMDATVEIIKGVLSKGVNVQEIYVDTLGPPVTHRQRLERIFPTIKIVVEKHADSLYPVVSAASVVAKVTRDVSCERLYEKFVSQKAAQRGLDGSELSANAEANWGSGYPSDSKCKSWLESEMNPLFGWGRECRLSWATAKDLLEATSEGAPGMNVDWPMDEDEEAVKVTDFFAIGSSLKKSFGTKTLADDDSMRTWFGSRVGQEAF